VRVRWLQRWEPCEVEPFCLILVAWLTLRRSRIMLDRSHSYYRKNVNEGCRSKASSARHGELSLKLRHRTSDNRAQMYHMHMVNGVENGAPLIAFEIYIPWGLSKMLIAYRVKHLWRPTLDTKNSLNKDQCRISEIFTQSRPSVKWLLWWSQRTPNHQTSRCSWCTLYSDR